MDKERNSSYEETNEMDTISCIGSNFTDWGVNISSYAADETAVYTLNPVTVTATRYEKKDVDIGATTQTFTSKEIEQTGADNMSVALQYLDGVVTSGMGPNGASVSSMTSKTVIRGVENGTVVMINGTPINWRGMYNLENIPTTNVERVEVVRGGGAVLYGSQATGGVINIITKKTLPNQVQAGVGNKGRQDYQVSANAGKLSVSYNYNKLGDIDQVSDYSTTFTPKGGKKVPVHMQQNFRGSEKNDFNVMYKFNDKFDVLYNHNESTNHWAYGYNGITNTNYKDLNGKIRYARKYERDKDFLQLNFNDLNGISGHVFYNYNTLETNGIDFYDAYGAKQKSPTTSYSKEKNKTYGYDIQKVWNHSPNQTFLVGSSLIRETYESGNNSYGRNIASIFGSWDRKLSAKDSLTIGGRGTWTAGGPMTFHNFSGQAQILHKLNDNQSLYVSAGQSFVLPTLSQMYARSEIGSSNRIDGNPDLKPQKGTHYEFGWKMETSNREYKAALFSEKIKDNISFSRYTKKNADGSSEDAWYTVNEDFKNKGLELSVRGTETNGVAWHACLTLQDPETKQVTEKTSAKRYWDRSYGKVLLNGGISYEKDKWSTALNFTYLADRVKSPTSSHSVEIKPYLLTSLSAKYSPNSRSDVILTVDNVLNRHDVISHTSSDYFSTPRNFILSYRYKF